MSVPRYLDGLRAEGIYCFSGADAVQALGSGVIAIRAALRRLRHKGEIAMPFRGFYVIVPPEFRNLDCLPANHFIPSLMSHLEVPYYAGLLTAAEHHGAAHHRPQAFQVVVAQNRPGLTWATPRSGVSSPSCTPWGYGWQDAEGHRGEVRKAGRVRP